MGRVRQIPLNFVDARPFEGHDGPSRLCDGDNRIWYPVTINHGFFAQNVCAIREKKRAKKPSFAFDDSHVPIVLVAFFPSLVDSEDSSVDEVIAQHQSYRSKGG